MKKLFHCCGIAMPILLLCLFIACNGKKNSADTETPPSLGCDCESSWFPHDQTPAPPEGVGSPFDTSSTTNCIFHQWSMQKFLWLTKPLPSGHPLFQDSMIQVTNQMVPMAPINGVSLVLEDVTQAGSGGILLSNASYGSTTIADTVYYAIFINSVLQNAADSLKNLILNDQSLINNKFVFPVGSLELKTAWVNIEALPADQVKTYHTTTAVLSSGRKITAALLGMHVVGVVINHPEFIWATFEHKDMAPVYNWKNSTDSTDAPVSANDQKLFFIKGYSATYNDILWPPAHEGPNVFSVYPFGVPKVAYDSFMTTSQQEPINLNNIQGLNACTGASLKDVWQNYFYNGSIWINTDGLTPQQQADSLFILQDSIQNASPGSIARGSLAAFNITMETYAQDFYSIPMHQMAAANLTNCFSCHNAAANITVGKITDSSAVSPLYLSHIFRSYLSVSSGLSIAETENLRARDFIQMIKAKRKTNK